MTRTSSINRYLAASAAAAFMGFWILMLIPPVRELLVWFQPTETGRQAAVFVCVGVTVALACRRPILTWRSNFRRFLLAVSLPLIFAPLFHLVSLVVWWMLDRKPSIEQVTSGESLATIAESIGSTLVATVSFAMIVSVPLGMVFIYSLQKVCDVETPRKEAI